MDALTAEQKAELVRMLATVCAEEQELGSLLDSGLVPRGSAREAELALSLETAGLLRRQFQRRLGLDG